MGKYEVRADVGKNRLYVSAEGFLTPEENKESIDRILEELKKLSPGFDMITDISRMKVATQEGARGFGRVYDAIKAMGRGHNILVVAEDKIARMQIDRSRREHGGEAEFVSSIEEAERMLDSAK